MTPNSYPDAPSPCAGCGYPVYSLQSVREYVQAAAKLQWGNLRPEKLVCTGMVGLPTKNDPKGIIAWYTCMRTCFDLIGLPETFIIRIPIPESLILISTTIPTYAEA